MPEMRLSPDKTALVMPILDRPSETMTLSVEAVESLIVALVESRAAMLPPPIVGNPGTGAPIRVSPRGAWYVGPTPQGGAVLAVLQPGLGWRGVMLSPEDEQRLEQAIHAVHDRPKQKN